MQPSDPVADQPMSAFQWRVVALTVCLLAIDGFDVLSISFAAPGIAEQWGIDRAALGIVLSMELIGMAVGSLVLGRLADLTGRRAIVLACLVLMAIGMSGAALSGSIVTLCACRFLTGIGLGGMLAVTNAIAAEVANSRYRDLCIVFMAAGYPFGNVVGGSIASYLLTLFGWQSIFVLGAIVSAAMFPVVWFLLPESIGWLIERRPPDALPRINAVLSRMGKEQLNQLPSVEAELDRAPHAKSTGTQFGPAMIALIVAYFAHIVTFYFLLKWIPKIVTDFGFPASSAGGVLVAASIGGLAGCLLLGLLTLRIRVFWLTVGAMVLSFAAITMFGRTPHDLASLAWAAALVGFLTNAGVVGLYAIIAATFPPKLRGTATGIVIGLGRGGSALSPVLAGALLAGGLSLQSVSAIIAIGSLLAAGALLFLHRRVKTPAEGSTYDSIRRKDRRSAE